MNLPARFNHTFRVEVIVASVVFGVVLAVLAFAVLRSFTARGRVASQKTSYKKTEITYASIVFVAAVALMVFSLTENRAPSVAPRLTVNVTGFQWCWRFAYPGTPVSVTADCVDGRLPTLVVPTGEVVRFNVTSADVIHSMWIPHLRFKLFAYPGYVNSFEDELVHTGRWEGQCAEFCGEYHYAMHFTLEAVTAAQFRTWLASGGRSI